MKVRFRITRNTSSEPWHLHK